MQPSQQTLEAFLVETPFFGGLDDRALALLAAMLKVRDLPVGSVVFREGDTGRAMYIIERGQVVMCRAGESGLDVHLVRLGEGDFFGETTLIEMQPRPYTARVDGPTRLLELTNRDLLRLYETDISAYVMVLLNMNRELCRRLRRADCRITEFADRTHDPATQVQIRAAEPTCP